MNNLIQRFVYTIIINILNSNIYFNLINEITYAPHYLHIINYTRHEIKQNKN